MRESARNIAKLLPLGGKVHIVDFISPDAEADMEYVPFAFVSVTFNYACHCS